VALRGHHLYDEALPFDYVRSTFEGVIDCFETDFANFFPKKLEIDEGFPNYFYNGKSYRGKYVGFYHHDLTDSKIRDDFQRRINRLDHYLSDSCSKNDRVIFMRTIVAPNYQTELNLRDKFKQTINRKYPNLNYILIFIVPEQTCSSYHCHLDSDVFVFTVDDRSHNNHNISKEYHPIIDFIQNNNLFDKIPDKVRLTLIKRSRLWNVFGVPMVKLD